MWGLCGNLDIPSDEVDKVNKNADDASKNSKSRMEAMDLGVSIGAFEFDCCLQFSALSHAPFCD